MLQSNIVDLIHGYKSLSIIGMEKNTGKTTTLNYIITHAIDSMLPLGLTSIGRDGEERDIVTTTSKPKIYVKRGTIIATAINCLYQGDITREIIETTGIGTPMGEIIIARALSDGYVELAGPSITTQVKQICMRLASLGCPLVIIDGALSRKTSASPAVTEASILCTGAALSKDMNEVIQNTRLTVELLSTEAEKDPKVLEVIKSIPKSCRISIIKKDLKALHLSCITSLDSSNYIIQSLDTDVGYVYIKGIITNKLLEEIMNCGDKYKGVTFLAENGTKLFVTGDVINKFRLLGWNLKVINTINLVCISCNPTSPYGYEFNEEVFLKKMREEIRRVPSEIFSRSF